MNNDFSPQQLDRHAYCLTEPVLKSWPLLLSTLESENLVVASGSSPMHILHRTFDKVQRTAGLTTGTAWHAKKQDLALWRRRHWAQILSRLAGKVCNW